jgi:putative addiction module CopG family antidote
MTIRLPEDLERYVLSQVQCGHFGSEEEVINEAVRLLQQAKATEVSRSKPLTEEELERQMERNGRLASIPSRSPQTPRRDFQPVAIKCEPLSETVIRERR